MSHDFRLPRSARLRLGAQYKALRDHGTSARGSLFRLSVLRAKAKNTCHLPPSRPPRHDQYEICGLTRIFHTDLLRRPGKQMDPALDSHCDLGGMYTYSPASKCSSALPHPPSRPPRHDQYEICGLTDFIQCGFIVSKRVGNAIVRNRVKRCLRELYRTTRPHLHSPLLIACIATPQAATASFAELRAEWHRLGKKLALF